MKIQRFTTCKRRCKLLKAEVGAATTAATQKLAEALEISKFSLESFLNRHVGIFELCNVSRNLVEFLLTSVVDTS